MNLDELIATAQDRTEEVRVCARGDLVAKHAEAVRALSEAMAADDSLTGSEEVRAAAEAVTKVEAEQEDSTVTLTVRTISRKVWADLLALYPPSKEQRRMGYTYDPVPFAIGMVGACVDGVDEKSAAKMFEALPNPEWLKLENMAFALNTEATPHPKLAAATELLRANGHLATTSSPTASPEADSLAGSGEQ